MSEQDYVRYSQDTMEESSFLRWQYLVLAVIALIVLVALVAVFPDLAWASLVVYVMFVAMVALATAYDLRYQDHAGNPYGNSYFWPLLRPRPARFWRWTMFVGSCLAAIAVTVLLFFAVTLWLQTFIMLGLFIGSWLAFVWLDRLCRHYDRHGVRTIRGKGSA